MVAFCLAPAWKGCGVVAMLEFACTTVATFAGFAGVGAVAGAGAACEERSTSCTRR